MSYSNFGFKSNVRSTVSPTTSNPKSIEPNVIEVRVIKSIVTITDSKANNLPVGAIVGESTNPNNIGKIYTANPLNPNITNIPVIGELVDLHKSSSPNSNGMQWLYGQPKGAYGTTSVNTNGVEPKLAPNKPTSQSTVKNYQAAALGVPITQPTQQNTQPAQSIEDSKISSLESNPGDIIYEGRHGQSLRLGNTEKNPIVILRNGQNPNQPVEPGSPIKENIQGDMSSLYLTSNQKISNFSLSNDNFNSFEPNKKPKSPTEYIGPQSILNSDRIILNAKKDSVLISGYQSVAILSNNSINLESDKIYSSCKDIRLGSPSAEEPALLGNLTIDVLLQLTKAVKNLAQILLVDKAYPEGKLVTSLNSIADDVISSIEDSKYGIEAKLNNGSLKSKSTKLV
jgi:hypothetical protein